MGNVAIEPLPDSRKSDPMPSEKMTPLVGSSEPIPQLLASVRP